MEYKISEENGFVNLKPLGNIKTSEAKEFEQRMLSELTAKGKLLVDFSEVAYICSGGLRALLALQQSVDEMDDGEFILTGVGEEVMSVFKSTGFQNVLTIR